MNKKYFYLCVFVGITQYTCCMDDRLEKNGLAVRPKQTHVSTLAEPSPAEVYAHVQAFQQMYTTACVVSDRLDNKISKNLEAICNGLSSLQVETIWREMPGTTEDLETLNRFIIVMRNSLAMLEETCPNSMTDATTLDFLKEQVFYLRSKANWLSNKHSNEKNFMDTFCPRLTANPTSSLFNQLNQSYCSSSMAVNPIGFLPSRSGLSMTSCCQQVAHSTTAQRSKGHVTQYCRPDAQTLIDQINSVISYLHEPLSVEALVVPKEAQVIVIGDIHGGLDELLATLSRLKNEEKCFQYNSKTRLNPNYYLVFTGDIADRGPAGVEVWHHVLTLKQFNPDQVFIVRGNHESEEMANYFGFFQDGTGSNSGDIDMKYPCVGDANNIKAAFMRLFERLPVALFIGKQGQNTNKVHFILYLHGGIAGHSIKVSRRVLMAAVKNPSVVCHEEFKPKKESLCSEKVEAKKETCAFNWSDFHSIGAAVKPSERGGTVKSYNKTIVTWYLKALSTAAFTVDIIAHGHMHMAGGICLLNNPGKCNEWIPLQDGLNFPIEDYSVVTFMCLPQCLTDQIPNLNEFACGIFYTADSGAWRLKTYITKYADIGRYVSH